MSVTAYAKENLLTLAAKVEAAFGEKLLGKEEKIGYMQFSVKAEDEHALLALLKNDAALGFTWFLDRCGVDYVKYPKAMPERFGVVTTLLSPTLGVKAQVRAFVGADASIPSVSDLFAGADWTEREIFDLYGVAFKGHPDMKRILMPDDYEGFPLRKDYPLRGRGERSAFPVYHAIPASQAPREP
ncbi:MAG TPA: NADH-quinone oxidoreductase subunit C [Fibrobacteria bacterium]|jgi:NADH-quinone oxidoreductase subunit C|nr:NADH-quinone oxidoreductase subunit C [Fibrobacteria bacterium]